MMIQLDLFASPKSRFRHELIDYLNEGSSREISVTLTQNRVTMISVEFPPEGPIKLRLHKKYLQAPEETLQALRTYLRTRKKAYWQTAAAYGLRQNDTPSETKPTLNKTKGKVYDLQLLMNEVNREFFNRRVRCSITWGRRRKSHRRSGRSCILYGSFEREQKVISIHPGLDDDRVPLEFVKYVIFHEMLHAVIPAVKRNGRVEHHGPVFRKMEKSYPAWKEMQNLASRLLHILD